MVRHETQQAYVEGQLVKTRCSGWTLAALAIAGLLVIPIVSVLSSFMTPAGEVWRHLWRTQLGELIANTVLLLAAVAYTILQRTILKHQGPDSRLAAALGKDRKGTLSLACYVLAIPLAFVHQWISDGLYVFVALLWLIPDRRIESKLSD